MEINTAIISSEKKNEVLGALAKAKREMTSIKKDSENPFHKSKYASLSSFINAIEEPLDNHGLILFQTTLILEDKSCILATILEHIESGQWIRSYTPLINTKNDCQGLGSAITYMRRYSMGALLGLCAEDDDGQSAVAQSNKSKEKYANPVPTKSESQKNIYITDDQVKHLESLFKKTDNEYKDKLNQFMLENYKAKSFKEIPFKSFSVICTSINNNLNGKIINEKI